MLPVVIISFVVAASEQAKTRQNVQMVTFYHRLCYAWTKLKCLDNKGFRIMEVRIIEVWTVSVSGTSLI